MAVLVLVALVGEDESGGGYHGGGAACGAGADSTARFLSDVGPGEVADLSGAAATSSRATGGILATALGSDEGGSCRKCEDLHDIFRLIDMAYLLFASIIFILF